MKNFKEYENLSPLNINKIKEVSLSLIKNKLDMTIKLFFSHYLLIIESALYQSRII